MTKHHKQGQSPVFRMKVGDNELVIRNRYEAASIINDFLIGLWFTIGSVFILFHALEKPGIWLFILGSAQLLIRPTIRITGMMYVRDLPESPWEA